MQRPIFVVISKTDTAMPKPAGSYYNHVAISFQKELNVMYSFTRYRVNTPYVGGFVAEKPSRYMLCDEPTPIKLYILMADDEDYQRIRDKVDAFSKNRKNYVYDIFSDISSKKSDKQINGAFTDVGFVCSILEIQNVHTVKQLEGELEFCRVYTGTMQKYLHGEYECDDVYYTRQSFGKVFFTTVGHFLTLALRHIKCKSKKENNGKKEQKK